MPKIIPLTEVNEELSMAESHAQHLHAGAVSLIVYIFHQNSQTVKRNKGIICNLCLSSLLKEKNPQKVELVDDLVEIISRDN